jgi:hypothetical protein
MLYVICDDFTECPPFCEVFTSRARAEHIVSVLAAWQRENPIDGKPPINMWVVPLLECVISEQVTICVPTRWCRAHSPDSIRRMLEQYGVPAACRVVVYVDNNSDKRSRGRETMFGNAKQQVAFRCLTCQAVHRVHTAELFNAKHAPHCPRCGTERMRNDMPKETVSELTRKRA